MDRTKTRQNGGISMNEQKLKRLEKKVEELRTLVFNLMKEVDKEIIEVCLICKQQAKDLDEQDLIWLTDTCSQCYEAEHLNDEEGE